MSGWGIGTNIRESGEAASYGYPESENPHLFSPDPECCTEQEMKNWEQAKKDWDNSIVKDLHIPTGWKKGDPLKIHRKEISGEMRWFAWRVIDYADKRAFDQNIVAYVQFYSLEKLVDFLKQWLK